MNMMDCKKKSDVAAGILEELNKKHEKEFEKLSRKLLDSEELRDLSERSKKKLDQEVYIDSFLY